MSEHYFVSADGVLGLQSNVRNIKWSWGINMPERSQQDYDACVVRLQLIVQDEVKPHRSLADGRSDFGKFHYFSGKPGDDSIFYERTFLGQRRLQTRLEGVTAGNPVLYVNKDYFKYVTHRFMNLHSIGYILTDLAALQLLRSGYAPLHCSGFKSGDATVLVLAAPNTGKTLSAMMACMEHGANFLAEDLAITDGSTIYSVPWTSTFRYYNEVDDSRRSRLLAKATSIFPPLELFGANQVNSIESYIPSDRILPESPVTHVAFLERGEEGIIPADLDDAIRKAATLNRYEFNYMKAPTLVAYEYFNPDIALSSAMQTEQVMLSKVLSQAEEVFAARAYDPTRYAELITGHV